MLLVVEHLLNLFWLTAVSGLFASVFAAHRRGGLHCSLRVALGATFLLAIVLFPALSMTDDLHRARLATEPAWRQLHDTFLAAPRDGLATTAMIVLPILFLLMLLGAVLRRMERLSRVGEAVRSPWAPALRPESPRPPPACLFA